MICARALLPRPKTQRVNMYVQSVAELREHGVSSKLTILCLSIKAVKACQKICKYYVVVATLVKVTNYEFGNGNKFGRNAVFA